MKFKFINSETGKPFTDEELAVNEEIPSRVDKWYNRSQKSWVVQLKDKEGNQIGEASYVYTKREAENEVNRLKKEYNLE